LACAADEARLDAGQAAESLPLGLQARQRPRGDRVLFALELELAPVTPREQRRRRALSDGVDEDGAGVGGALQPGGEVDGVAEGGVLDPAATADLADDDRAGRDADTDAEAVDSPASKHL